MSKEMGLILLGVLNIVIATGLIGVPTNWRDALLIISGITITTIGLLLRGETLGRNRSGESSPTYRKQPQQSFVENTPSSDIHTPTPHEESNS